MTSNEHIAMSYGVVFRKLVKYEHLVVPVIKSRSSRKWLQGQNGSWNNVHQVPFAEILTSRGSGFSFNIMDADMIFKTDA
jgi:hypothetical protein